MAVGQATAGKKTLSPKVLRCDCKHDYQDQKYGAHMRFHNHAPGKNAYRCVVCKSVKQS